jgi:hypothetical protein
MRYFKTTWPVAAFLLLAGVPTAWAEPIVSESGTMQTFSLTTTGFQAGSNIVTITFPDDEFVTNQNGKRVVDIPAAFGTMSLVLSNPTVVGGVTSFNVTWLSTMNQVTPTAAEGAGAASFSYFFNSSTGFASVQGDIFNLGMELSMLGRNTTGLDYSPFQSGGSLRETLTASTSAGASSLAAVLLSSAPASAVGSGAFSQVAYFGSVGGDPPPPVAGGGPGNGGGLGSAQDPIGNPEPASVVLFGTGAVLCGCWARWRRGKRSAAAA